MKIRVLIFDDDDAIREILKAVVKMNYPNTKDVWVSWLVDSP